MKHIKAAQKAVSATLTKLAIMDLISHVQELEQKWISILQNKELSSSEKFEQGKELSAELANLQAKLVNSPRIQVFVVKVMQRVKLDLRKIEQAAKKEVQKPQS
jgi:hypothetical protein